MLIYPKPLLNKSKAILILFFLALNIVKGQTQEHKIQEIMDLAGTPGIQISYHGPKGNIQVSKGIKKYGESDYIDSTTRFQAASLTKVFATYTFFRLMDRGLIDLDKPLLMYYPYDRLANTINADKITARMVLTHRTGLLNWEGDVPSMTWRNSPLSLQFTPGTDYMYSGEGFYFLQETMEHITGKSFQQLVEEEILIPMDLNLSNIVWNDSLENQTAYGHYELTKPRKLGKYKKTNAAYTLYTTASDYLTFVEKAIINGQGLKKSTHQQMLQHSNEAKKDKQVQYDDKYVPCALGFRMQINEVGTAYWHTGSNPGFRCFFITYPKTGETLTAFMNSDTAFPAMKKIMELFLAPKQTFWAYDWRNGELD